MLRSAWDGAQGSRPGAGSSEGACAPDSAPPWEDDGPSSSLTAAVIEPEEETFETAVGLPMDAVFSRAAIRAPPSARLPSAPTRAESAS